MTFTCSQCNSTHEAPYDNPAIVPFGWSWCQVTSAPQSGFLAHHGKVFIPVCDKCVELAYLTRRDAIRTAGSPYPPHR